MNDFIIVTQECDILIKTALRKSAIVGFTVNKNGTTNICYAVNGAHYNDIDVIESFEEIQKLIGG